MEFSDRITQQLQQWQLWEKYSKQQVKYWRELQEALQRGDLKRSQKLLTLIGSQSPPDLSEAQVVSAIRDWCEQEERQLPLRFIRELRQAAENAGLNFQQLGNSPPVLRLDPFLVEMNYQKSLAEISYARQKLTSVPLDCQQILSEHGRLLKSLEGSGFDATLYLSRVFEAYRRSLASQGLNWGERVDLMEILPELVFLLQSESFRKDPVRESFRPYGKVRFAYDLARLRRGHQLEHQGARLTLGTATLGSTRQKDRVVFLEEAGQGQYYLSLAFQGGKSR